jgi:hypothetical protein
MGQLEDRYSTQTEGYNGAMMPPEAGWNKVNVDDSFDGKEMHGGGGLIIRDHHGVPLVRGCHFP